MDRVLTHLRPIPKRCWNAFDPPAAKQLSAKGRNWYGVGEYGRGLKKMAWGSETWHGVGEHDMGLENTGWGWKIRDGVWVRSGTIAR